MSVPIRAVLLGLLLAGMMIARTAAQEPPPPTDDPETPVFWVESNPQQTDEIRRTLRAPLTEHGLVFQSTSLAKVVDFLREEYDMEIQLDQPALDDLALSPNERLNVNLRGISLGAGLRLMLRQLELTYVIRDEVLLITTEQEAWSHQSTAIYPVGDLLANNGGPTATLEDLIDVIIGNTASDRWTYNGGPVRSIRAIQPGLLVITVNQDLHEQIQQLLKALRRARQHEFTVPHKVRPPKLPPMPGPGPESFSN
ncbi:hypothetical protein [Aeoliella sp.]|uniref:hypothetical protein n=1 Tax=Aeoliella sp. TaxID=2795800 RepID=UPI003CCBB4AB